MKFTLGVKRSLCKYVPGNVGEEGAARFWEGIHGAGRMGEKTQIFEKLENSWVKLTLTDRRRLKPTLAIENLWRKHPVCSTESPKASGSGDTGRAEKWSGRIHSLDCLV